MTPRGAKHWFFSPWAPNPEAPVLQRQQGISGTSNGQMDEEEQEREEELEERIEAQEVEKI